MGDYLRRAKVAGLSWPLPEGMDERALEARLFPGAGVPAPAQRAMPDWAHVHTELRRKGVTLSLLWQGYKAEYPDGIQYSQLCERYRAFRQGVDVVMRHSHRVGEKLFVDYAGHTTPIVDRESGEQPAHAARALVAVSGRETFKFVRQRGRLFSALVRPTLWLVVFAVGFQNVFGVSIIPPYETYIEYQEYIVPGLVGMVLLFNGMQSSLAMVYDREMGMMRLLLTAPLPRWYLLFSKLVAGTVLSVLQVYAFLIVTALFGVGVPSLGWVYALPAIALGGMMLGATGLLLSVYVKQLENFAGTMNFVIFPMFFISSALYPLWKLREAGAEVVFQAARFNPFIHVVESVRFSLYGEPNLGAFGVVAATLAVVFVLAVIGYDPQRGLPRRMQRPG